MAKDKPVGSVGIRQWSDKKKKKILNGRFIKRKSEMFKQHFCSYEIDIIGEQLLYFPTKCLFMLLIEAKP